VGKGPSSMEVKGACSWEGGVGSALGGPAPEAACENQAWSGEVTSGLRFYTGLLGQKAACTVDWGG
jgi:hypothetical protein